MPSSDASVPGDSPRSEPPISPPPRRRLPAWAITIPLLCLAAYGGYRLGQPAASTQTGGFGQGQFSQAGAGGQRQGQGGQAAGAQGQPQTNPSQAGPSSSGQSAGGAANAADGQGSGRRRAGAGAGSTGGQAQPGQTQTGQAGQFGPGTAQGQTGAGRGQFGQGGFGSGRAGRSGGGVTIPVTATAVKAGTLTTSRSTTGTVAPAQTTSVSTRSSGTVTTLSAQVGQSVKAGQTVVLLSNSDLNASVQSAQNALQSAQAQLANQSTTLTSNRTQLEQAVKSAQLALQNAQQTYTASKAIYDVGALAKSALDTQALAVQQAQGNLVTAQANLSANTTASSSGLRNLQISVDTARLNLQQAQTAAANVKVVAPFDGQVTALSVTDGEYLNAGSPAFSLVSSARTLTFNAPPSEAAALTVGRPLSFSVAQTSYPIKISQNPGAPTGGSVQLTARFIGEKLPPLGSVGTVQYQSTVGTGTLVPTTALQIDNANTSVYVVAGGKAKMQDVTVIGQTGDTAVVSGLKAGAQVIGQPPAGLIDGASVSTGSGGAGRGQGGGFGGPPGAR
ncbi:hypothetical protein GCM10022631_14700 [Deinococcus rubellus]|uniref:Efflux RND transporter periplasmic adaptor subunit n=1 Tax=Deinococcus rubellus TaxID=1889240 RepID=A0ABY5YJE3_9DEIO|nr:efflux RND transporter periplasmic adaptor subunit [Deinococcus rubellus]UWX64930.1 efflux RND transporter periplasmic adaptor subunit [Deinococcus rubellus]